MKECLFGYHLFKCRNNNLYLIDYSLNANKLLNIVHKKYVNKCVLEIPIPYVEKELYTKLLQLKKRENLVQIQNINGNGSNKNKTFAINAFNRDNEIIILLFQDITDSKKKENNKEHKVSFNMMQYGSLFPNLKKIAELQNTPQEHEELITEFKKNEERMQLAQDVTNEALWDWIVNKDLYFSPQMFTMLGYVPFEFEPTFENYKNLLHPDDKEGILEKLQKFLSSEKDFIQLEFRIKKKDGAWRWIFQRVKKIGKDKKGDTVRLIGTNADITERKNVEIELFYKNEELTKAEEELRVINEELKYTNDELEKQNKELKETYQKLLESDRLKSTFLANISHEIRTPMNGILGFSGLLLNEDINLENKKRYQNILVQSGKQLLSIIDDIIDISKIETNQLDLDKSKCDMNKLIHDLFIFYERYLNDRHKFEIELLISTGLKDEQAIILTDPFRLRQVLSYIIDNSVKYTEKGCIKFGYVLKDENLIEFFVSDTGIGIPDDMIDAVFEPFRQVDEGHTRIYGGTGLGLPIARGIVKLLGGNIWIKSKRGESTETFFTIPYKTFPPKQIVIDNIQNIKKEYNWSDKAILVVEDDELNFEYIKAAISLANAGIIHTTNGEDAIEICKSMDIDLILMDIRLPKMNGFEATKKLRELGFNIPILAQTAYAMREDEKKCFEAGCDAYITKPLEIWLLLDKIQNLLLKDKK